jgi:hypothetical protein
MTRNNRRINFNELFSLTGDSYDNHTYVYNTMVDQFCETEKLTFTFRRSRADFELGSPFIPMSKYRDVAVNVAYWCSKEGNKGKEFIVLKMNIPLIETLSNTGPFFFESHANRTMNIWDENNSMKTFCAQDYEHLVYGNIPSKCIEDVQNAYLPLYPYKHTPIVKDNPSYVTAKSQSITDDL